MTNEINLTPTRPSMIRTVSGRTIDPENPQVSDFCIGDIAHALSLQCRWGGHVREFYSVAEHSRLVSEEVERRTGSTYLALVALLHDGTEAFLVDLIRPIKRLLPGYLLIEVRFATFLSEAFRLESDLVSLPREVKEVDDLILNDERDLLFTRSDPDWSLTEIRLGIKIECLRPEVARARFLARYTDLVSRLPECGRPAVPPAAADTSGLSEPAQKLLRQIRSGAWFTHEKVHRVRERCASPVGSPKPRRAEAEIPGAIDELVEAGLIELGGRVSVMVLAYVPVGTAPLQREVFPLYDPAKDD